jgi:hypothetical protein
MHVRKDNSCAKRNALIREKRPAFLRLLLIRSLRDHLPHIRGKAFGCARSGQVCSPFAGIRPYGPLTRDHVILREAILCRKERSFVVCASSG